MTSNTTFLSLIAIALFLFTATIFVMESSTTIRWQERAINNYNAAVQKNVKPAHIPEPWWTDNPFWVAYKVWKEDKYNWISLFVSIITYSFVFMRKRLEKEKPPGGAF